MTLSRFAAPAILATSLAFSAGAQAAPLVHDSLADFSSVTANQGAATAANSTLLTGTVSGTRSNLANMFDGNSSASSLFSLGFGGTLDFVISPTTNSIAAGSVIELTNIGARDYEVAQIYLGVDGMGWQLVGEIRNGTAAASLGRRIATAIGGELHGAAARVAEADLRFASAKDHVQALFAAGRPIVAVMAAGALIRLLAPLLPHLGQRP